MILQDEIQNKNEIKNGVENKLQSNEDLELLNRLIEEIDTFSKIPGDKKNAEVRLQAFEKLLLKIPEIIQEMPYKAGSAKSVCKEIPWDHFEILADIIQNKTHSLDNNNIVARLKNLILDPSYIEVVSKELKNLSSELKKIRLQLIAESAKEKETKTETNDFDYLKEIFDSNKFDEDDSLEKESISLTNIQSITYFYRDIVALSNIGKKLEQHSEFETTQDIGDAYAGLIMSIGEDIKKLSPSRRTQMSKLNGKVLGEHKLTLLNRLWMYKKSRDAIRHSADYPEGQLVDLKKKLMDQDAISQLAKAMREDKNLISSYYHDFLSKEIVDIVKSRTNKEALNYLKVKLTGDEDAKPKQKEQKENVKKTESAQYEPPKNQLEPLLKEEELLEFGEVFELLKNQIIKKKNTEELADKWVEQLKKFLISGNVKDSYNCDIEKISFQEREKGLKAVKTCLCIVETLVAIKNESRKESNKDEEKTPSQTEKFAKMQSFLTRVSAYLDTAYKGEKAKDKKGPGLTKPKERGIWKESFETFVMELGDYSREKMLPKLLDKSELDALSAVLEQSVTIHRFLFNEFLGKGFHLHPNAIKELRKFTYTENEKYDEVFETLAQGKAYTKNADLLLAVKEAFTLFIFGDKTPNVMLEQIESDNSLTRNRGSFQEKFLTLVKQFNYIFDDPTKLERKNEEKFDVVYKKDGVTMKPWEDAYEKINDTLLYIRMLLSTLFRKKYPTWKSHPSLEPSELIKKQKLHLAEISVLLGNANEVVVNDYKEYQSCKTWEEVIDKMTVSDPSTCYKFIYNMALISEHIKGITYLALNYLIPYIENNHLTVNEGLLEKYKGYIQKLRTYGNTLAHADLQKENGMESIFSPENFLNVLSLLKDLSESIHIIEEDMTELLSEIKKAIASHVREFVAERALYADKGQEYVEEKVVNPITTNIMHFTYPYNIGSFGYMMDTFGVFKKSVQPSNNEIVEEKQQENVVGK